jgi:hypothetical protein
MQSNAPAPSGGGGMLSGIVSTIAQGMAFGTGSATANRAVGAVASSYAGGGGDAPKVDQQQQLVAAPTMGQQQVQGPCAYAKEMFFDCLKQNKGDQESCSFLYQQLQSCQSNETQQVQGPCAYDKEMFVDCLKQNNGDQESCFFLYQQLQSCQSNERTFG